MQSRGPKGSDYELDTIPEEQCRTWTALGILATIVYPLTWVLAMCLRTFQRPRPRRARTITVVADEESIRPSESR